MDKTQMYDVNRHGSLFRLVVCFGRAKRLERASRNYAREWTRFGVKGVKVLPRTVASMHHHITRTYTRSLLQ